MLLSRSSGMTRQQISNDHVISGPSVTCQMDHVIDVRIVENRSLGRSNHYHITAVANSAFARLSPAVLDTGGSGRNPPFLLRQYHCFTGIEPTRNARYSGFVTARAFLSSLNTSLRY